MAATILNQTPHGSVVQTTWPAGLAHHSMTNRGLMLPVLKEMTEQAFAGE